MELEIKIVHALKPDPSKQEEIDFINRIAAMVPPDAYLAGLFNPGFLAWIETRIRDDFSVNVMAEMKDGDSSNQNLRAELEKTRAAWTKETGELQSQMTELDRNYQDDKRQASETIDRQMETIERLTSDYNSMTERNDDLIAQIDELKDQIRDLKVIIADLYLKGR